MTLADYLLSGDFLGVVTGLWLWFGPSPALTVGGVLSMLMGAKMYGS